MPPTSSSSRLVRWAPLALVLALGGCLNPQKLLPDHPDGTSVLSLLRTDGREIELNEEVAGSLSASDYVSVDGSYLEAWSFEGEPGQRVYVDLMSDDFDAYLYVVGPGLTAPLRDDDSGGACHARIDFTVLDPGTFRLVASTLGSGSPTRPSRSRESPAAACRPNS